MEKFVIEGGVPLSGTITPSGNKNGALPILAACLLTDDEVILRNVPRIADVEAMVTLLETLGAQRASGSARPRWRSTPPPSTAPTVDRDLAERIRASFLLAGPLLARFGSVHMPPPGGDVIGRRRLDPHLDAFRALGATVANDQGEIALTAPTLGLRPCDFLMDEPSVMATENALMAAALTRGTTVIRNAASEPHVQDLARMLERMGAAIDGIGSNVMTVHGQASLRGCTHEIAPDHIEIGSFMALAGVTGGELVVKDTRPDDLRMIRLVFERLGLRSEVHGLDIIVPGNQELRIRNDHGDHKPKVEDGPWPAFPADLTSIALALATQSHGSVIIHEKMFENRLFFTDKLVNMGAEIIICDPAPGDRRRPAPAARRARRVAGHPRGHGDADRRAVRRGDHRDRQHPADRPRLRAHRRAPAAARRAHHTAGRRARNRVSTADRPGQPAPAMVDRIPSGTRDVLPDEMRELRAMTDRMRAVFDRAGFGEVYTPALEYEQTFQRTSIAGAAPAYRMFDEHGGVLVLRPDMTVPIARLVATRYAARRAAAALLLRRPRLPRASAPSAASRASSCRPGWS